MKTRSTEDSSSSSSSDESSSSTSSTSSSHSSDSDSDTDAKKISIATSPRQNTDDSGQEKDDKGNKNISTAKLTETLEQKSESTKEIAIEDSKTAATNNDHDKIARSPAGFLVVSSDDERIVQSVVASETMKEVEKQTDRDRDMKLQILEEGEIADDEQNENAKHESADDVASKTSAIEAENTIDKVAKECPNVDDKKTGDVIEENAEKSHDQRAPSPDESSAAKRQKIDINEESDKAKNLQKDEPNENVENMNKKAKRDSSCEKDRIVKPHSPHIDKQDARRRSKSPSRRSRSPTRCSRSQKSRSRTYTVGRQSKSHSRSHSRSRRRSPSIERRREARLKRHAERDEKEKRNKKEKFDEKDESKKKAIHSPQEQHTKSQNSKGNDVSEANSAAPPPAAVASSEVIEDDNATVTDPKARLTERERRKVNLITSRTGGAYIPPAKLRQMQAEFNDKSSAAYQRIAWEALKKTIHGHINKVNVGNIGIVTRELLRENILRGKGLLCRSIIQAQTASPTFTHVYAALVAIINCKFPKIGELLLNRLLITFKRAFRRNDKTVCLASSRFVAHLVNQRVAYEVVALEILTLLVETPTDDSVEVAIAFLKECGMKLTELTSKGVGAIFEMLKNILHEGKLDKRVQYMIEVVFQIRKDGFKDHQSVIPELDIIEEEDQFTHMILLDDAASPQENLNFFNFDEKYEENETKYKGLCNAILGDGNSSGTSGSDSDGSSDSDASSNDGDSDAKPPNNEDAMTADEILDKTETTMIKLRRFIYLTINSSLDYEECAHKLLKMQLKPGQEVELCHMFLDCCAEQRTYEKFFGLLAQRFCNINKIFVEPFEQIFKDTYQTTHRLDTNRLRNVSKFFAHLLFSDSISWDVFECVKLTEDDTTSSSRIFLKTLFQELSEFMSLRKLNLRLKEAELQETLSGLFPKDNPKNTRFAINFFTSIGLGGLTDDLRRFLKSAPRHVPAINVELLDQRPGTSGARARDDIEEGELSDSDSDTDSDVDSELDSESEQDVRKSIKKPSSTSKKPDKKRKSKKEKKNKAKKQKKGSKSKKHSKKNKRVETSNSDTDSESSSPSSSSASSSTEESSPSSDESHTKNKRHKKSTKQSKKRDKTQKKDRNAKSSKNKYKQNGNNTESDSENISDLPKKLKKEKSFERRPSRDATRRDVKERDRHRYQDSSHQHDLETYNRQHGDQHRSHQNALGNYKRQISSSGRDEDCAPQRDFVNNKRQVRASSRDQERAPQRDRNLEQASTNDRGQNRTRQSEHERDKRQVSTSDRDQTRGRQGDRKRFKRQDSVNDHEQHHSRKTDREHNKKQASDSDHNQHSSHQNDREHNKRKVSATNRDQECNEKRTKLENESKSLKVKEERRYRDNGDKDHLVDRDIEGRRKSNENRGYDTKKSGARSHHDERNRERDADRESKRDLKRKEDHNDPQRKRNLDREEERDNSHAKKKRSERDRDVDQDRDYERSHDRKKERSSDAYRRDHDRERKRLTSQR